MTRLALEGAAPRRPHWRPLPPRRTIGPLNRRSRPVPSRPARILPLLALAAIPLAGCQRNTTLVKWANPPSVGVATVEVVAVSDEGASASIQLAVQSNSEVALPLTFARYTLEMGGRRYEGATEPNVVVPAGRALAFRLPAAVEGDPGDRFTVRGSLEYEPPGQIRKVFTDVGIPLPTVGFRGEGRLTGEPTRVADVPTPAPTPDPTDGDDRPAPEADDDEQP